MGEIPARDRRILWGPVSLCIKSETEGSADAHKLLAYLLTKRPHQSFT